MMYSMALTSWFVTDSISLTRWASAAEKSVYSEREFRRVDARQLRQGQFAERDEILHFDADAVADEGLFGKIIGQFLRFITVAPVDGRNGGKGS